MRPKINSHDYETKKAHVVRFLHQGAKVKVTIMFRGRETLHAEFGENLLDRLAADVGDIAKVETPPKLDGRNMTMVLNPNKEAITPRATTPPRPKRSRPESRPETPAEDESKPRPPKVTRAEGG